MVLQNTVGMKTQRKITEVLFLEKKFFFLVFFFVRHYHTKTRTMFNWWTNEPLIDQPIVINI